jgi:hypothetical protein
MPKIGPSILSFLRGTETILRRQVMHCLLQYITSSVHTKNVQRKKNYSRDEHNNTKAWGFSLDLLPNASELLHYQKDLSQLLAVTIKAEPLWPSFFVRFAGLLTGKALLYSHPNGCRVPKLTVENSKGMSPPIHQHAHTIKKGMQGNRR